MHIAVGSTNPAKVEATRLAFKVALPARQIHVEAVPVDSTVSNQPMNDREALRGGQRRAVAAIIKVQADFGVGIEGGLSRIGDQWFSCSWVVIVDVAGAVSSATTLRVAVPYEVMDLVRGGLELEDACHRIYGVDRSAEKTGYIGLLTNDLLTRASSSRDALIAALAPLVGGIGSDREYLVAATPIV